MLYRNFTMPKVRVATGLYSHWDSIIKVDEKISKWIDDSESVKPKSTVLNSIEEVTYNLKSSNDIESLISKKLYDDLNTMFPKREWRLGSNGNNVGRTLLELGLIPLVSYPCRAEKLMLSSPNFKVALGNKLVIPRKAIRKDDPDYDHIIFESEKWRNIFSWDLMSSQGIFDKDFLKFAFDSKSTDIAIIGYAHLLLPKYKKRTDYLLDFIKKERPKVHLEFGSGCEESMKYAMKRFAENEACDSWGMNEKECRIYLKANSDEKEDLIESTFEALKDYNLERICVHSSKFAFSVSKYDSKKEVEALEAATLIAGLRVSDKISLRKEPILKKKLGRYNLCIVPSFFNPYPKRITGVGDTFAAVQAVKILS